MGVRSPSWHVPALAAWALLFSFLPQLLSGVPLHHQLSSDAEQFAAAALNQTVPAFAAADQGIPTDLGPALWAFEAIRNLALATGTTYAVMSVWISILWFLVFVVALYYLIRAATADPTAAFVAAACSVIPVHALGASTFGFQPLGVLARDVVLALAMLILIAYVRAIQAADRRSMLVVFAACGIAANFYSLYFGQLFLVLALTEWIRLRAITPVMLLGVVFSVCALPGVTRELLMVARTTPVDVDLMRRRHDFLMAWPIVPALTRYLRRFILYTLACAVTLAVGRRLLSGEEEARQRPWTAMLIASGAISIAGVLIESTTPYMKFLFSKTSVYFYLAAIMTLCLTLPASIERVLGRRSRALSLAVLAAFLLFQSNLPSLYRSIRDMRASRGDRQALFEMIDRIRHDVGPGELVLVPSPPAQDLACTVRAHAERAVYATYKDGALALLDGELARQWWARYTEQEAAFNSGRAQSVVEFARAHGVKWVLLDRDRASLAGAALSEFVVDRIGPFTLLAIGRAP